MHFHSRKQELDASRDFTTEIALLPTGRGDHVTLFIYFWKICNYQSHSYLIWKSSNVVRITLV